MLHQVRLHNGSASYSNRWVETEKYLLEKKKKRACLSWYGRLHSPLFLAHVMVNGIKSKIFGPDVQSFTLANTSFEFLAGRFLALMEGAEAFQIEVPSLKSLGTYRFEGNSIKSFSAHPKIDPDTKESFSIVYSLGLKPYASYLKISSEGKLLKKIPIDLRKRKILPLSPSSSKI